MLESAEIPYGEFLPDHADYKNPGCIRAENVIPIAGGYGPFRGPGSVGGAATGQCRGSRLYTRSSGDVVTIGGGADRLWVDIAGQVTETTGISPIGADGYWQFERFGQRVLAVAPNNQIHQLENVSNDSTWVPISEAPTGAKVIGEVDGRAVVGSLRSNPYQIQWAALNDPTSWAVTATNYAGSAEMRQDYGEVTGIAGDRFSMVFQERGVSRITRVGPPTVFQIDPISEARGCVAPGSIAVVDHLVFFLSHDGFCVTNGAQVDLIGSSRVNRYFFDSVSGADLFRTHAAIDWTNECVVWSYIPKESTRFQGLIIYSWAQNRFSTGTFEVDRLVEGSAQGVTMDSLDSQYPNLDEMDVSLDSVQFQAVESRLAAYLPVDTPYIVAYQGDTPVLAYSSGQAVLQRDLDRTNAQLRILDGPTLEANFETGEMQPQTSRRTFINRVYPIVENTAGNSTAAVVTREVKGGMETVSDRGVLNTSGFCPVRADGLFCRVRHTIPAGAPWDNAQGVQVRFKSSGER